MTLFLLLFLIVFIVGGYDNNNLFSAAFRLDQMQCMNKHYPDTWQGIKDRRNDFRKEMAKVKKFGDRFNRKNRIKIPKSAGKRLPDTAYIELFMKNVASEQWISISEFTGDNLFTNLVRQVVSEEYDTAQMLLKRKIDHSVAQVFYPQREQFFKSAIGAHHDEPTLQHQLPNYQFGYKIHFWALNGGQIPEEQDIAELVEEMATKEWVTEGEETIQRAIDGQTDDDEKEATPDRSLAATMVSDDIDNKGGKTVKELLLKEWGEAQCLGYKEKHKKFPWEEEMFTVALAEEMIRKKKVEERMEGKTMAEKTKILKEAEEERKQVTEVTGKTPPREQWEGRVKPRILRNSKLNKADIYVKKIVRKDWKGRIPNQPFH
jgi:hypothetical protein